MLLCGQVHTSQHKMKLYEQITELQGVFTSDPRARIHACAWQVLINDKLINCSHCCYCKKKIIILVFIAVLERITSRMHLIIHESLMVIVKKI